MVVGELAEQVDLLVVGGGPGGYVAAARAAELGREVTLVERGGPARLGGSCLHVGCIPSKALIELANAHEAATARLQPGLSVGGAAVDLAAWQDWRQELCGSLAEGVDGLLRQRGVRVLEGELRFNKPDRAALLGSDGSVQFLEFREAILATGSRPATLPGLELDGERVLDSTGALALTAVPAAVAIVGAGYIGLEIGTALAKLGAEVNVIEALDRPLPGLDPALARPLVRNLERLGVGLHLGARAERRDGDELVVAVADGELRLPAAKVVVAVGRRPNSDDLGLDRAGVEVGAGGLIPVDARLRTNVATIAAIGDLVAGPALAHKASAEGAVAAESLCGLPAAFEPAAVPAIVFTDPELAAAGLGEAEARAAGLDPVVATLPLAALGRARTLRAEEGFVRIVADRGSDRVVGVQIAGPHASELIAEGVLAIEMMASPRDLADSIHPHPTLSEGLREAAARLPAPGARPPA
ncbi:MAG: dihydrolipoyl dehydrogenase [Actinobacteria bacterium]|nr:dihydrolipoyl dehydrogenase [Actinomycetota bacterium]